MEIQWAYTCLDVGGWAIFADYTPQMQSSDYRDLVITPFLKELRERHWEYVEWYRREYKVRSSDESEDDPEWEWCSAEEDEDEDAFDFSIIVQNGNPDAVLSAVYASWVIDKMLGDLQRRHDLFMLT
jgi:hypothetical protein